MEILALLIVALILGAIIAFIRLLLLPGEVRELRDTVATLQVELRAMKSRLDTARDRIERMEIMPPAEPRPETPTMERDEAEFVEDDQPLDDEIEEIIEEAKPRATLSAAAAEVPPPLPTAHVHEPPRLPIRESRPAPEPEYEPLFGQVGGWLKSLGPKDPNMTWEMALGTYWLPRLGALAISAAIVFLLTLAFQKWGAGARVLMGYGVSGALLGAGWWLDRNYPRYARVLFGAGFALTYFVTFGTYFIPFAKVLDTPYVSLAGQAAIVAVWAGMAQRRQSQVIAGIAVLMGHFTIALATHSIDKPGPYSVAGIAFLSAGGAFFLARNGWYAVAGLGLLASYANHFYLMTQVESRGTVSEFVVGMTVLSVYFLTFALAELMSPEDVRRKRVPFWFRNGFVTVNSVCLLLLGSAQMSGYDFTRDVPEMFYYALAAVLLAFCLAYLRLRAGDPLYNTYFVKGISAATLGLAFQFDAHTLTLSLALESLILLYAARRNGLLVTRVVAIAAGALAVWQGLATSSAGGVAVEYLTYEKADYWKQFAEAAGVVLSLFAASLLYQRTDWASRSPRASRFSAETRLWMWQFDLIAAPPPEFSTAIKPLGGLLAPFLYAGSGALLTFQFGFELFIRKDYALAMAIASLVLTIAAALLRSKPFGFASFVTFAIAAVHAAHLFGGATLGHLFGDGAIGIPLNRAIPMWMCLATVALASEQKYLSRFDGLALHQRREVAYVLYGVITLLLGLLIDHHADTSTSVVLGSTIASAAFFAAAIPLRREALAWCGIALLAWAALRWNDDWATGASRAYQASGWGVIALGLIADRYLRRIGVKFAGPTALVVATVVFVSYSQLQAPSDWLALAWTAGAAFLLIYAAMFSSRMAGGLGVALLVAASMQEATLNTRDLRTYLIILGFAAPAVLWIVVERALVRFAPRMKIVGRLEPISGAMAAIATALLVLMLYRLPQLAEFYLTISWSVLAVALFGVAIASGDKLYRWCGLAVLGLAFLRAGFIDTRQLEAVSRIFALGGLGFIALALGYGYSRVFARTEAQAPRE